LFYVALRIEKYKKATTIAAIGIDQYFKEIAVKQNKFTWMYLDRMVTKLYFSLKILDKDRLHQNHKNHCGIYVWQWFYT
jgi:hypothetical protein